MEAHSLERLLIELVQEEACCKDVTLESTFEELGIDSLDFICLLQEIRKKIGPITDEQAVGVHTVGDLFKVLSH